MYRCGLWNDAGPAGAVAAAGGGGGMFPGMAPAGMGMVSNGGTSSNNPNVIVVDTNQLTTRSDTTSVNL